MHVYKITNNLDERYNISSNNTFSMSFSFMINIKTTKIT